jgi:putative hemolysin
MQPRVQWLDGDAPQEEKMLTQLRPCPHAQPLVGSGAIDDVAGVLRRQDLLDQILGGDHRTSTDGALPRVVHESTTILRVLDLLKDAASQSDSD